MDSKYEREKTCKKVVEYEELEEQGRLIVLPCKVGDAVYVIDRTFHSRERKWLKCTINEFVINESGAYAVLDGAEPWLVMRRWKAVNIKDFGHTVFLSSEEAELK